ncbi:hypothetical protein [Polaribacter sp. IC063]|uniref:hypothetical protein n=1 Tax=Polaribacter sp. IC063 TaxID=57031 RepID=UPI0011BE845B|nr:hypothetical protein [Polaribacter sp. IC063]TXD53925.1 hypothetical protein ES043_02540 [Polaribacter sp. IC063]
MIAYLDTCTILNLIQINYNDEYIKHLKRLFVEIKLTPKVFEELERNKYDNVIDDSQKMILNGIIYNNLKNYIDFEDFKKELEFTKKHNPGIFKENGESYSISQSIMNSRYGKEDFGEHLLKTYFISDDAPAKEEFGYFYQINVVGQMINTIDLMTVFWLKQYITKNELIRYCNSLKQLYNKDLNILSIKIKEYKSSFDKEITPKQHIIITKLISMLSDITEEFKNDFYEICNTPEFRVILKKNNDWNALINRIKESQFREKIPYIIKRIKDFKKVYSID